MYCIHYTNIVVKGLYVWNLLVVYCEFLSSTAWGHKAARTGWIIYIPQSNFPVSPSSQHDHIIINCTHTQTTYCMSLLRLNNKIKMVKTACTKFNHILLTSSVILENGGKGLAQSMWRRVAVSMSHMDTSLLPLTALITDEWWNGLALSPYTLCL